MFFSFLTESQYHRSAVAQRGRATCCLPGVHGLEKEVRCRAGAEFRYPCRTSEDVMSPINVYAVVSPAILAHVLAEFL